MLPSSHHMNKIISINYYSTEKSFLYFVMAPSFNDSFATMFHRFCIGHLSYITVVLDNDKVALFENPKVEQTEMSSKCLCCIINLIQPHREFHVQKKLIKENSINLVAVGFAFIGRMMKAD